VEPTGNGLAIVPEDLKEASIQDSTDPRHLSFDDTSAYVASAQKAQASKMQVETDPVNEAARSCRRTSLFSAVDRDNDGFISPQELRQALEVGLIRDGRQSISALPSTPAAKAEEPLGKAAHVPMSERVIEASASSTRASASAVVDGSFLSPSAVYSDTTGLTPTPIQNEGGPQPMRTPQLAIMGLAYAETSRNLQPSPSAESFFEQAQRTAQLAITGLADTETSRNLQPGPSAESVFEQAQRTAQFAIMGLADAETSRNLQPGTSAESFF
jgi:hypothetical protein